MKYAFHPEAKTEFLAAIDFYEECEPGLGADFAIEVRSTIKNILSFPNAWPILEDDLRRSQTRLLRRASEGPFSQAPLPPFPPSGKEDYKGRKNMIKTS